MMDFNMDCFSLKGKTALITGGNSGLGQAFSFALAKAGANIFALSLMDDGGETASLMEGTGAAFHCEILDITKPGAPKDAIQKCLERFHALDILINCAGICLCEDVASFDRDLWDPMVAINLTAAFEMSFEASKVMMKQKSGKIINICSLFSFLGGQRSVAYAATKHGIAGLTRAYCDELAQYHIQVNGIAAGYFDTALSADSSRDQVRYNRIKDHIPAGRWGDVSDLMGAAVFLSSAASDYINGHILTVDGGYLVR